MSISPTFPCILIHEYFLLFREEDISIFVNSKFSVLVHNSFSLSMVIPLVDKNIIRIKKNRFHQSFLFVQSKSGVHLSNLSLKADKSLWSKVLKIQKSFVLINLWKGCLVTMNLTEDSSFSIVLICFFLIKGAACLAC